MLAYHKFNVISCLFVLKYSISDSGGALENIWKDCITPIHTQRLGPSCKEPLELSFCVSVHAAESINMYLLFDCAFAFACTICFYGSVVAVSLCMFAYGAN